MVHIGCPATHSTATAQYEQLAAGGGFDVPNAPRIGRIRVGDEKNQTGAKFVKP